MFRDRFAFLLLLLALLPAGAILAQAEPDPPLVDPFREWRDVEKNSLTKSRFAYVDGDQACLWPETGQRMLIPVARLSEEDREWIADHPLRILRGKVVFVADGDTIGVLDADNQQRRVRLEGIDAPESNQAFGNKSKRILSDACHGKEVLVVYTSEDQYGRILGQIYVDDRWLNHDQIESGMAWHYRHFSGDAHLAELQKQSQKAQKGIWSDPNPQQPWRFRLDERRRREAEEEKAKAAEMTAPTGFWLNSSSGVRHNAQCDHYGKTSRGRYCTAEEGKPCGICGG
ncbi:thermonuclease family protein [Bremerella cremea]|uniref:thermonuclease family protein n=1 Tax=Bremerella cremea TaxID=1031537 RepID=UPI0031EF4343